MTKPFEARRQLHGKPEVRNFAAKGLEVRSTVVGNTISITGYPIVYNSAYIVRDQFGEFRETMSPGVVTRLLARGVDCRFLFNHGGLPLARTTSGTLTLTDTPTKLGFTANLDARQSLANDLAIAIERGDLSQMSVGMIVGTDSWADEETRTIYTLDDLSDVSAVTYPASPTTSIALARSRTTRRTTGRTQAQFTRDRIRWDLEDIKLQRKLRQYRGRRA